MAGDGEDLKVRILRYPGQIAEGSIGVETIVLHEDPLCLPDNVTVAERCTHLVSALRLGERERGQGCQQGGDPLVMAAERPRSPA